MDKEKSDKRVVPALRARSDRLIELRMMAKVSRTELAKRCGLSQSIVSSWENLSGKSAMFGISARSAAKVIEGLKQDGIIATVEWLMFGEGEPPSIQPKQIEKINRFQLKYAEKKVVKCINAMVSELDSDNLVVLKLEDDTMHPSFKKNDYVVGMPLEKKSWRDVDGDIALVELEDNKRYLRIVKGLMSKKYILVGLNPKSSYNNYLMTPEKIIAVYQVIGHIKFG